MKPQTSCSTWLGIGLMLMCGVGGTLVFLQGALNEPALQQEGQIIEARVTETGVRCRAIVFCSTEVTYQFTRGNENFDATESVSQKAWDKARTTGTISVRYLPAKPWIHHAAEAAGLSVIAGNLFGVVVCALVAIGGLGWLVKTGLDWAREPAASPAEMIAEPVARSAAPKLYWGLTGIQVVIVILLLVAIVCVLSSFAVYLVLAT